MRIALWSLALLVCACSKTEKVSADKAPAASTSTPAMAVKQVPPPPPSPLEQMMGKTTLSDAIAFAKPSMEDSRDDTDKGTLLMVSWLSKNPSNWAAIQALPDTSIAKVLKDSEEERGKRLCVSGRVIQIHTEKLDTGKIFSGTFATNDSKYVSYLAAGSSGELVERSPAKFCGVVTGRHSYSNVSGGTTHAVRAVGLFDLPENKKGAVVAAQLLLLRPLRPAVGRHLLDVTH